MNNNTSFMVTVTKDKSELQFDGWEMTDLPEDCVLLILEDEDKSGWVKRKSGIHIPAHQNNEKDAEKFRIGRVLAVGDGCANWIKNAELLVFSSDQLTVFKTRGYKLKDGRGVIIMGQGLFMGAVKPSPNDEEENA